jgi:GTP cyclohydrolase FolE2
MMEEWLTTKEVMTLCRWNNRRMVQRASKREKWRISEVRKAHGEYLYRREDVLSYLRSRQRTKLISHWKKEKGGRRVRGLMRDTRYDTTCPICQEYAIYEPPMAIEEAMAFVEEIMAGMRKVRCINGHESG